MQKLEEEKKQKEIEDKKLQEEQQKQQKADEEMVQLAIEMSMREFEEEEKKREQEKVVPKNALAKSLASAGAGNKYSKQGFIPKAMRKEAEAEPEQPAQQTLTENEYYDYGYEYYTPR